MIEAARVPLVDDVGVLAEEEVVRAFSILKATDLPGYLRLTLLAPAIIQSILAGQQPKCMRLLWFQRNPVPTDWVAQRGVVAGFDA